MIKKMSAFFARFFALGAALLLSGGLTAANYAILGLSYASGDPSIHINSSITVQMEVASYTQTYGVSVTAANTFSATLTSPDFAAIVSPAVLFVTDGRRTWQVNHPGGGATSIAISAANVMSVIIGSTAIDYNTLANQTFRVYGGGALVTNLSAGLKTVYADLGAFAKVQLYDDGSHGDGLSGDGVWTGVYNVPDLGFVISGAHFFGVAGVNQSFAGNSPFQSPQSVDIDALRPAINTYQFSTNKPNYNGILYISGACQDTSCLEGGVDRSSTNAQGRFDFTVNKRGSVVAVDIKDGFGTLKRSLPRVTIPPSASNLNGWITWDGRDDLGNYLADGVYIAHLGISDFNSVQGVTLTTPVRITSVRMDIKDISLTPAGLQTEPAIVNGIITRIAARVEIFREGSTGLGKLKASLANLGWTLSGNFNQPSRALSWLYSLPEVDFLKPDGSVGFTMNGYDSSAAHDTDYDYLNFFLSDPRFAGTSVEDTNFPIGFPNCYFANLSSPNPLYPANGSTVNVADGNGNNDWDIIYPFNITAGTPGSPDKMEANISFAILGNTPAAGSYRFRIRSLLSSLEPMVDRLVDTPSEVDRCVSGSPPVYFGRYIHFVPSAKPSGFPTSPRGYGIYSEDSSVLFSVSTNQPPTSDTTAPVVVVSDPLADSEVVPGIYSSSKPLSVQVQDLESAITVDPNRTNLRLFRVDASGTQVPIGGQGNPDGGNPSNLLTLYFKPNSPINAGGNYLLRVNACNVNGLCVSKDVAFKVQDRAAPGVAGVELVLSTQTLPFALTLNQTAPDGPVDNVTEIRAQLAMPQGSTNTIDWDASTISLIRNYGTTATASTTVPLKRVAPLPGAVPSDGKLRYALLTPIDYAGNFEVIVQTFAKDGSGNVFSGPASFINPQFITQVNTQVFKLYYPLPSDGTYEGVTGLKPITITSGGLPVSQTALGIQLPNYSLLPPASGYVPLSSTAGGAHGFRFVLAGTGVLTSPLRFDYAVANPVRFKFYYNDSDLPAGVPKTSLALLGYNGSSWQVVGNASHDSTAVTRNSFTVDAPLSANAFTAYGIFYSAPSSGPGALPTPTPVLFKDTRAFNPVSSNAVLRRARFYYGSAAPKEMQARIFDTSGVLVRTLSLGQEIKPSDFSIDPIYGSQAYWFEWDGRNDAGTLVRNGLYLVRWNLVRTDGSSDTATKPVALIK